MRWQIQEAKQRFSEVLRAAEGGEPQIVTKHGQEVAVVIDITEYRRLRGDTDGLMQYLRADHCVDTSVPVGRTTNPPRLIDLFG